MKKWIGLLLAVCLAAGGGASMAEEEAPLYFFPSLGVYTLAGVEETAQPLYIVEFLTLNEHPLTGEPVGEHFYAYDYVGARRVSLGIPYDNGFTSHAYSEQLSRPTLAGYRVSFADAPRENIITAKTFESGVQWTEEAMGKVEEVYLVGGERFYLMLELLEEGGNLPYSRTEIDAASLAIGESLTVSAAFDYDDYEAEAFDITVEKVTVLRQGPEATPSPAPTPASSPAPTPEPTPEPTAFPAPAESFATSPTTGALIDQLLKTQSQPEVADPSALETKAPSVIMVETEPAPTPPPTPRPIGKARILNERVANVRGGPSAEDEIVYKASPNDGFDCLRVMDNGWYEILLPDGSIGYVSPRVASFTPAAGN